MKHDLVLNSLLYPCQYIERAIADYSAIAKITFEQQGDKSFLSFSDCKVQKEITIKEFCNYLIDLQNVVHIE